MVNGFLLTGCRSRCKVLKASEKNCSNVNIEPKMGMCRCSSISYCFFKAAAPTTGKRSKDALIDKISYRIDALYLIKRDGDILIFILP